MEKCIKTNVYSNHTIFSNSLEQAIDVDFTLPDYCPDISKIFKCKAVPRISSKGVNGKTLTIEGNVCITVLYADGEGKIYSYEYQYPFQKNTELTDGAEGANIKCRTNLDYIHCRAVSGRKIDIHGAVSVFVNVFNRKCREILSDFEYQSLELKKGITPATVPMGYAEKYLVLEDTIPINQPNEVQNILRYEAAPCVKESKIVNEKIVLKGEMSVCVLYTDFNCMVHNVKTVIPFSQIVDLTGINESCELDTKCELAFLEIKQSSSSNDNASFNLNAKILFICEAFCPNDIAVVFDAFSRKYKADISKDNMKFTKVSQNIFDTFTCKNTLELSESISSVVDLSCEVISKTARFENDCINFSGSVLVGIIAVTADEEICYFDGEIPFMHSVKAENINEFSEAVPQIEILSCNYTFLSDAKIEICAQLQLNAAVIENKVISLITDISIDEKQVICEKCKTALTLYFPNEKQELWEIAQMYNASVEEIAQLNGLTNGEISVGKFLLVPML